MWIKIMTEKENMSQEIKSYEDGEVEVMISMSGNKTVTHVCKIVVVHRCVLTQSIFLALWYFLVP